MPTLRGDDGLKYAVLPRYETVPVTSPPGTDDSMAKLWPRIEAIGASVRKKLVLLIVKGSMTSEKGTAIIVLTGTPMASEIGFVETTVGAVMS